MTHLSLTLPLWYLPLLFTAAAYMWALKNPENFWLLYRLMAATIISLVSWLVWALLT